MSLCDCIELESNVDRLHVHMFSVELDLYEKAESTPTKILISHDKMTRTQVRAVVTRYSYRSANAIARYWSSPREKQKHKGKKENIIFFILNVL